MGLLDYFRTSSRNKNTASVARDRLQILVAQDRSACERASYLPQLKKEILEVIRKYVEVDMNAVSVHYEQTGDQDILELNIILPDPP